MEAFLKFVGPSQTTPIFIVLIYQGDVFFHGELYQNYTALFFHALKIYIIQNQIRFF